VSGGLRTRLSCIFLCHLAGISHHENSAPSLHGARNCGGYLILTLILSSLNPKSRMGMALSALGKDQFTRTKQTPKGEAYWASLCKGSELCLVTHAYICRWSPNSKQQTFPLCHQRPLSCCAGLLGANFAQILLNAGKFDDPIARGLSTSGAAHGLGTAAMAAT